MAIRPRTLRRASLLVAATTLVMLAACGSSGEGDKSAAQILQDTAAAVKGVSSYHVSGSGSSSSGSVTFDLRVAGPNTVSGSLNSGGATINIIVVNGSTYFQGKDFFAQFSPDAASLIGDSWVLIPPSQASSATQGLDTFTDTSKLSGCITSISSGSFTKATGTANSEPVVILQSSMGYSVAVASSGTPYPVQITGTGSANLGSACGGSGSSSSGSGNGTINFDSWGQSVTVTPPPNPLDLSSILGSGGSGSGAATPEATPTPS